MAHPASLIHAMKTMTRHRRCRSSTAFEKLPLLKLPSRDASQDEERAFSRELRVACHTVGFFYVTNHDICPQTYADALESSKRFFDLEYQQKMKIDYRNSPAFRGYMSYGVENTAGLPDRREQVEFGVDGPTSQEARMLPFYKRLVGPNQWPDESIPELRHHVGLFMSEMEVLSRRLMKYLALSLDLSRDYFDDTFRDRPNVQMKICKYPAVEKSEGFGVGAHTDSGYLSLLLQDEAGGLQVQNGEGQWIDAPPVKDTIVVNLGEMLQLCTSGYFVATPHRVLNGKGKKARYSMPYFWNPRLDFRATRIDPLPKSLDWQRPQPSLVNFTSSHGEAGNKLIDIYGENAFKSLARSHPEVMRRHHDDLVVLSDGTIKVTSADD